MPSTGYRGEHRNMPIVERLFNPRSTLHRYSFGVSCAVLALAFHWLLMPIAGSRFPFLFFVPLMLVAAAVAGHGPGIIVLATGAINSALVLAPAGSLLLRAWQDQVMLGVFVLIGAVLVSFGSRYRRIERKAADAEQRLSVAVTENRIGLFEIDWLTRKLLGSRMFWELAGIKGDGACKVNPLSGIEGPSTKSDQVHLDFGIVASSLPKDRMSSKADQLQRDKLSIRTEHGHGQC